jgi:photosystem II stability/assembly factor-like uncharacterized protein
MFRIKNGWFFIQLLLGLGLLYAGDCRAQALALQTDAWVKHAAATTDDFHRGFFLDDNSGWLVTHSTGLVLRTTDGGKSWLTQQRLEAGYLESIFFTDKKHGWICGDKGRIYRTADGGNHWQQVGVNRPELVFTGVHFFNRKQGMLVGMNTQSRHSILFASSDGGQSWQDGSTRVSGSGLSGAITFLNKRVGFIAGFNTILRTTDGGRSWQLSRSGQGAVIRDITFFNGSKGLAVGHKGLLLATEDEGQHWQVADIFADALLRSVVFINKNFALIAGDRDGNGNSLWQTNDGGKTWRKAQGDFPDIHQIIRTKNRVYLIGDSGTVLSRRLAQDFMPHR